MHKTLQAVFTECIIADRFITVCLTDSCYTVPFLLSSIRLRFFRYYYCCNNNIYTHTHIHEKKLRSIIYEVYMLQVLSICNTSFLNALVKFHPSFGTYIINTIYDNRFLNGVIFLKKK